MSSTCEPYLIRLETGLNDVVGKQELEKLGVTRFEFKGILLGEYYFRVWPTSEQLMLLRQQTWITGVYYDSPPTLA